MHTAQVLQQGAPQLRRRPQEGLQIFCGQLPCHAAALHSSAGLKDGSQVPDGLLVSLMNRQNVLLQPCMRPCDETTAERCSAYGLQQSIKDQHLGAESQAMPAGTAIVRMQQARLAQHSRAMQHAHCLALVQHSHRPCIRRWSAYASSSSIAVKCSTTACQANKPQHVIAKQACLSAAATGTWPAALACKDCAQAGLGRVANRLPAGHGPQHLAHRRCQAG